MYVHIHIYSLEHLWLQRGNGFMTAVYLSQKEIALSCTYRMRFNRCQIFSERIFSSINIEQCSHEYIRCNKKKSIIFA